MTDSKKTFTYIGLAMVIAYAVIFAFSNFVFAPLLLKADMEKLIETIGPSLTLLLTDVPNMIFLLVFWLVIRRIPKSDWQKETMSFKSLLQVFVMMYAVSMVFHLIGLSISQAAPAGGTEQLDMINQMVSSGIPTGIMMTVIIAPVLEELIFRKLMLDRIRNYGEKTAIVFSALCFGLFHQNLTQFLFAFSVGLFLGYVYCKTGKVIYTMIMHALLNLVSSSIMLLLPQLTNGTGGMVILAVMAVVIVALFIMGFVQLIRHLRKKDLRLDNSMITAIPSGEVVKTVYLNPCVMLFIGYTTASIVMGLMNITF
jgi:membrane protease YdiL (CAAX protease family)